jgi:hypothetical protein
VGGFDRKKGIDIAADGGFGAATGVKVLHSAAELE